MAKTDSIRFLPSYVGSKRSWLPQLQGLRGRPMVELFCGSAVLSANLASKAILIDYDPIVYKILSRFPEQIVPEEFTREDYYRLRFDKEWWKHAYCLQSMSYSGVFRYSKKGFNVPAKGGEDSSQNKINTFYNRESYEAALERWIELEPIVRQCSYIDVTDEEIAALGDDVVVILDPPYEGSQAAYNTPVAGAGQPVRAPSDSDFNYDEYWTRVEELTNKFDVVIFDRQHNLASRGYSVDGLRKMRVNGAREGDVEAMSLQLRVPLVHDSDLWNLWDEGTDTIVA